MQLSVFEMQTSVHMYLNADISLKMQISLFKIQISLAEIQISLFKDYEEMSVFQIEISVF